MSEYAIEVKDLCIQYKSLRKFSIKQNLLTGKRKKADVVEAVKHVSFQLEKGEILGIVGKNGSGKSTMLRAIAGIFSPNSGSIDLHGNSISLLSIGVGFQSALSGRENILLSGMLLGFSEEEIRGKMKQIIEFSELGKFIDAPVRTYSSGMYSKLAFSITAVLETDIMLIDEVLSVGDSRFRRKSYNKMKQLINDDDRTVVIVSHDAKTISELCTKVLWLNEGELVQFGNTDEVLLEYNKFMAEQFPENQNVVRFTAGEPVVGASYQWQYRTSPTGNWRVASSNGNQTPILSVTAAPFRNGYEFRCIITEADGNVRLTEIQTMNLDTKVNT